MSKSTHAPRPVLVPTISVGVDLGADSSTACYLDRSGTVVQRATFRMTPAAVREEFGSLREATVVLEACGQSAWVSRVLEELGLRVVVANPRKLKLIAGTTLKTDDLDAEVLARLARLSQLDPALVRSISVRSRATQLRRREIRGRDQLVQARTGLINFVRSTLREDAIRIVGTDADTFAENLRLEELPDDLAAVVRGQVEAIRALTSQIRKATKNIEQAARGCPNVKRLMAIDGVGPMVGLSFILCIEDPARFRSSRDIGPYLGLVPTLRQSSSTERRGSITKAGDGAMRRLLVQAALVLMRSKHDSDLQRWALRLAARRGRKKAVVALARKLAVVMHRVWATGETYERLRSTKGAVVAA